MKKNLLMIVFILLILGVGVYFYLTKTKNVAPEVTTEKAKSSLSTGVEKTNPFNVNVNPYQGYKNPFK